MGVRVGELEFFGGEFCFFADCDRETVLLWVEVSEASEYEFVEQELVKNVFDKSREH